MAALMTRTVDPQELLTALMSDVHSILGITGLRYLHRPLNWLTRIPLLRFCQAFAETDRIMAREGFAAASGWLVRTWFARDIQARGQEHIPREGPLVVVSNHPGAFDSAAIGASLGRDDLRIIASNAPFLRRLPTISRHLIFIGEDALTRMVVIRESLHHLETGGALLVFGTGLVDPDPACMPGAERELENWYSSVEIFLRKMPQARLVETIVSGVLHPPILRNPLIRLQPVRWKRQRLAEFLQFVHQMVLPGRLWLRPQISFSRPLTLPELEAAAPGRRLLAAVIDGEKALLAEHRHVFGIPARV